MRIGWYKTGTFTNIDASHQLNTEGKLRQNRVYMVIIHFTINSKQANLIYVVGIQKQS